MLYFTKRVCGLVPKLLTDVSAALERADKKGLKNWAKFRSGQKVCRLAQDKIRTKELG
jgi:hypothetical protein